MWHWERLVSLILFVCSCVTANVLCLCWGVLKHGVCILEVCILTLRRRITQCCRCLDVSAVAKLHCLLCCYLRCRLGLDLTPTDVCLAGFRCWMLCGIWLYGTPSFCWAYTLLWMCWELHRSKLPFMSTANSCTNYTWTWPVWTWRSLWMAAPLKCLQISQVLFDLTLISAVSVSIMSECMTNWLIDCWLTCMSGSVLYTCGQECWFKILVFNQTTNLKVNFTHTFCQSLLEFCLLGVDHDYAWHRAMFPW